MKDKVILRFINILFMLLAALFCNGITALADEGMFSIDDAHIYDDMDKSYSEGYTPVIADNEVRIVMPLYTVGDSRVDFLIAVPSFENDPKSPFIQKNISKTFVKEDVKQEIHGKPGDIFIVRINVPLKEERINGVYPLNIKCFYYIDGQRMEEDFICYVTISDGISQEEAGSDKKEGEDKEEDKDGAGIENADKEKNIVKETVTEAAINPDASAGKKTESEPKLVVKEIVDMPEEVYAGDEFTISFIVWNTSRKRGARDIIINVGDLENGIYINSDSNTFYYDSLSPNEELVVTIPLQVYEMASPGKYSLPVAISYDDEAAITLSTESSVNIPVSEKDEVLFEIGKYSAEIRAGDEITVPVQVMNLGAGSIRNIRVGISGTGVIPGNSLFLGDLDAGTATSGDLLCYAGIVNDKEKDPEKRYGKTTATMVLTYEDRQGNENTISRDISVNISPIQIDINTEEEEKDINMAAQLCYGILSLLGIVIMVIILSAVMKNKH